MHVRSFIVREEVIAMGTFETIAVVAAVYAVVYLAHHVSSGKPGSPEPKASRVVQPRSE